jgi:fructoselysine 6-kinase
MSRTSKPRQAAPIAKQHPPTLLSVGDNVVDRYPQYGTFYPGGNAVNVAVHARRLGLASAYLGAIGTDRAGQALVDALHNERVDTSRTRIVDGSNAFAVVEVIDGNRVFRDGDLGVSMFELSQSDLMAAASYDIVHTGECSGVEDQLNELARAGVRLSYDFSERPWSYVEQFAPRVDIATWSSPTGDVDDAIKAAERLRSLGPSIAAVTLGPAGAVLAQDIVIHHPAPTGQILDTLGAGDAFISRLLAGVIQGEPMADVLASATAYATAACASFGAFGYPTPLDPSDPLPSAHRHHQRLDVS